MGDECFEILMDAMSELELLERLYLNVNRNCITPESLATSIKGLEGLGMLQLAEFEIKRNIRRVEDKEIVRQVFNALPIKIKKLEM